MPSETEIAAAIVDVATAPASTTTDGQTVTEHALPDLIEADRYQAAKAAAAATSAATGKKASGFAFLRMAQAVGGDR